VAARVDELCTLAWNRLGIHRNLDPFMALCFMALPVIPKLKITDMGLFDVNAFRNVPVEVP
jgi:adenine deaminase